MHNNSPEWQKLAGAAMSKWQQQVDDQASLCCYTISSSSELIVKGPFLMACACQLIAVGSHALLSKPVGILLHSFVSGNRPLQALRQVSSPLHGDTQLQHAVVLGPNHLTIGPGKVEMPHSKQDSDHLTTNNTMRQSRSHAPVGQHTIPAGSSAGA